jgi:hypothetical protein
LQVIHDRSLKAGVYKLALSFTAAEVPYYKEFSVNLQ